MSWQFIRPHACPAGWELSRAFSEGTPPELAIHLRRCERCSAEWEALERTREAASTLPAPTLGEDDRVRLLATLLAEVGSSGRAPRRGARTWRRVFAAVASCAAAIALLLGARGRLAPGGATGETSAVAIHAVGAATFTREQPPPDEIVRLDEGTLELDVAPLRAGQRLRIATADAQLETEGGRLEVSASAHQLLAVRVWRGRTELRGASIRVTLKPGDQWTRATGPVSPDHAATEPRTPEPQSVGAGAIARGVSTRSTSHLPPATVALRPPARIETPLAAPGALSEAASTPQRASFERGWRLLRAGDPKAADEAFRDVERQSRGDAIAEDAVFWRAVAEARAGASREARETLTSFISRFPSSARAGEASAMLGWMLLDAPDLLGARRAFERASADPVDRVRASAQAGLARVAALTAR